MITEVNTIRNQLMKPYCIIGRVGDAEKISQQHCRDMVLSNRTSLCLHYNDH